MLCSTMYLHTEKHRDVNAWQMFKWTLCISAHYSVLSLYGYIKLN